MDNFKDSTILIVDDEAFLVSVLKARLGIFGAQILTAANGQEALEIVSNQRVDAVLTDIDMPVMNGLEFLSKVRSMGLITPVVILTGQGDQANMLTALRLGATDFLDKPFESKVVQEVMEKALRIGAAGRAVEAKIGSVELSVGDGEGDVSADEFRRWKSSVAANVNNTNDPDNKDKS